MCFVSTGFCIFDLFQQPLQHKKYLLIYYGIMKDFQYFQLGFPSCWMELLVIYIAKTGWKLKLVQKQRFFCLKIVKTSFVENELL